MAYSLGGCTGLLVPNIQEFYHADPRYEQLEENKVVFHIQCELHKAIYNVINDPHYERQPGTHFNDIGWLNEWGAKVTLTLTVDEKGSLNPGVTFFVPFANSISHFYNGNVTTPQSFSFGAGLIASSDATRKEIISWTLAFSDLLNQRPVTGPCQDDGVLIDSDLKIQDFIANKIFIARVPGALGNVKPNYPPFSAFSDQITFVVVYGGNVTPVWKFVHISGSSTSPLINSVRTKTQDVLITLGAVASQDPGKAPTLSDDANAVNNASLIGQAVSTSNSSQQR